MVYYLNNFLNINLLNTPTTTNIDYKDIGGIQIKYNQNTKNFTIKNKATQSVYYPLYRINFKANIKYFFKVYLSNNTTGVWVDAVNTQGTAFLNNGNTVLVTEDTVGVIRLRINNGNGPQLHNYESCDISILLTYFDIGNYIDQYIVPKDIEEIDNNIIGLKILKYDTLYRNISESNALDVTKQNIDYIGGYIRSSDDSISISSFHKTYIYNCSYGDKFIIKLRTSSSGGGIYKYLIIKDSNDIELYSKKETIGTNELIENIIINYKTASKLYITTSSEILYDKLEVKKYGSVHLSEINKSEINNLNIIISKSNINNKKVVWFGTSIPEGGYNGSSTAYPKLIGSILGINVYNESVGSSSMHIRQQSRVSETNPYGFNASFKESVKAFTGTLIETPEELKATKCYDKEWLVNWYKAYNNGGNYVSGYENDCPFDASVFNLSSDYQQAFLPSITSDDSIRNYSYQRKLDKYLTEENFPDLFVFDHGRNDIGASATEADNFDVNDPFSPYCFRGIFNYIIDRIYKYRYDAKICMIGHYSNQIRNNLDPSNVIDRPDQIVKAQQYCADYWELKLFDLWNYTGWSNKSLTIDGTTKSMLSWWLPDSLHPHSDTTGKANNHLAKLIAPFIHSMLY